MARMQSTMLALGTSAPAFRLADVTSGQIVSLETFEGKQALLVMFLCRHCPYVKHVQGELSLLGTSYRDRSLGIVAISSNDAAAYPEDAPTSLAEMAREQGFTFPFCHDESQAVAQAFNAVCTPEFYLFDEQRKLVYRGQLDDSGPRNFIPVTGKNLRAAIEATLQHQPVDPDQKPSLGCSIKWRNG